MSKNKRNFKLKTREKDQGQRQQKISHEINAALVECFQKSGRLDPLLGHNSLTITKINISPDLRLVNCFFLPFGNAAQGEKIEAALEKSKFAIRDYVTKKINLKYSPEIRFFFDKFYETMKAVEEVDSEKSE